MTQPPIYNMPQNAGATYVEPLIKWLAEEANLLVTYTELVNKRWQIVSGTAQAGFRTQVVSTWPEVVGAIRGIVVAQQR